MTAIPEWALFIASVIVPIGGLILALDTRASNRRKDMHAKIDDLRAFTETHHRLGMASMNNLDKRLAVIEDRSRRIRRDDNK